MPRILFLDAAKSQYNIAFSSELDATDDSPICRGKPSTSTSRHLECHVRIESPRGSAGSSEARANSFLKLLFTLYSVEERQLVEQIRHLTRIQLYFLVTLSYLLSRPRKHPLGRSLRQAWHPIQIVKLFCNPKSIPPTRLCSLQSEHAHQFGSYLMLINAGSQSRRNLLPSISEAELSVRPLLAIRATTCLLTCNIGRPGSP